MLTQAPFCKSQYRAIFILMSLLLTLAACSSNHVETTPVTIATPAPYKATAENTLGTNENGKGLNKGTEINNLALTNIHGDNFKLADAWKEKPALIVFYRGGWCPYCNMQVRELAENYQALNSAGVQPVLISVDAPDKTALLSATYQIPFPVLSDPQLIAHQQFNVILKLDEATLVKYREYGINLSDWSGQEHNAIAVASVFIIDQQGRVLVSHTVADYSQRPSVEQLLELIEQAATDK